MITNEDLERIKTEAKAIQDDSSMTLKEREAALDLWLGASRLDIARIERHLIETGHEDEVKAIHEKARA